MQTLYRAGGISRACVAWEALQTAHDGWEALEWGQCRRDDVGALGEAYGQAWEYWGQAAAGMGYAVTGRRPA